MRYESREDCKIDRGPTGEVNLELPAQQPATVYDVSDAIPLVCALTDMIVERVRDKGYQLSLAEALTLVRVKHAITSLKTDHPRLTGEIYQKKMHDLKRTKNDP